MDPQRQNDSGVKFTVTLPKHDAADVKALEEAVRAAGFDLARSSNRESDTTATTAAVDELTGLLNRNAGFERLHEFWALAIRHGEPLSCLAISVDQMRAINERFGMRGGDHVLRELSRLLRAFARAEEQVCRLSGNEFLVICPRSTSRAAAIGAERHRWAVQSSPIMLDGVSIPITISVGVAERHDEMTRIDELLTAACGACAAARVQGGNRVRTFESSHAAEPAPLLDAVLRHVPTYEPREDGHADRSLVLHDDTTDTTAICSLLSRQGLSPTLLSCTSDIAATAQLENHAIVVAVIGRGGADWYGCIRNLRAATAARRIPVLLWGEPASETECQKLLNEGADAFVMTTDAPRTVEQLVRTLLKAHTHQQQLAENQAMRAEQARMLTTLFDLARAFASADTLDHCLDRLSNIASEMLRAGKIATLVCNRERSGLSLARISDDSVPLAEHDSVSTSEGLIGTVCQSRESLLISDLAEYRHKMTELEQQLITEAPAAVTPMVTSQHVVGVLIACARPGLRSFKPWEVAMLDLLSNIAAAAIDDYHSRTARDEAREAIVVALAKLTQHRDGPTAEHVDRVARTCVVLAHDLARTCRDELPEIDDAFISNLEWAVPLHDIGKVGLPDHILLKPGRLTDEEMQIMRSHVEIGQSALHSISQRVPEAEYLRMAEQIAHAHHEWYDGSGYPMGLKGEEIPLAARIAAVADVYDAITSSRVYKGAIAHDTACEEIRTRAGSQFDPRVVEAFMRCRHMFDADAAENADRADAA